MHTFDSNSLELLRMFEMHTHAKANDVVQDGDNIIFLVEEGSLAKAIGKAGSTLQRLRQALKPKTVEVVEDAEDLRVFVAKVLRGANIREIMVEENPSRVIVSVDSATRGLAIGRNGVTIKKLRFLLKRKFNVGEAKIV